MPTTSLDFEFGWKYSFIKLKFKPIFGLTDDGPRGEEAVTAWETVMHDIYFLGGGGNAITRPSDTYWGRIIGTENEIMIVTGLRGTTPPVIYQPPLLPSDAIETTPNILSPLDPFLLQNPIIINIQWTVPPPSLQQERMYCELNLFHIPTTDESVKNTAAERLYSCDLKWYDHGDAPTTALESAHCGNLYIPEGRARSFRSERDTECLRDSVTFAHLTKWASRASAESYKDPKLENEKKPGWSSVVGDDWYQVNIGGSFAYVVEKLDVRREEIQVEFRMWVELFSEEEREEYLVNYLGSMPTRGIHGKECEKCGPLLE